jgi:hypothetical protein
MKKYCLLNVCCLTVLTVTAQINLSKVKTDRKAVEVLNKFMQALRIEDADSSAKAVMQYTHRSLWNSEETDLTRDLRQFSFKKAHSNARFYQIPVKVTRVRETAISAIGYGETAEKGKVSDYFVGKKSGVNGMPAPVQIFFPADGSAPKISYMGSL